MFHWERGGERNWGGEGITTEVGIMEWKRDRFHRLLVPNVVSPSLDESGTVCFFF